MELKWRRTNYGNWQLWWDDWRLRCAEMQQRPGDMKWVLTLSYNVSPMDLAFTSAHDTLEEAKEYTENLVRVLIIGGHHERN